MKTSLRAILFDFDGVLANTEPIHLAMFQKVLAPEGITLSEEDYYKKYLGLDDRDCFAQVFKDQGQSLNESKKLDLIRAKNKAFLESVHGQDLLLKGVRELVEEASKDYYLAVVSGALKSEVQAVLSAVGLDEKFRVIIGAEDVSKGKPDPEGFLLAVRHLNRDFIPESEILIAEECLVIEDSPWGVEAAQAAGAKCLGVLTSYPENRMASADMVLPDLQKFPWDAVKKLF